MNDEMKYHEHVSNWLTTGGKESPDQPIFPNKDQFKLALSLILEELDELARSSNNSEDMQWWSTQLLEKSFEASNRYLFLQDQEAQQFSDEEPPTEPSLIEYRDALCDLTVVTANAIHFAGLTEQYDKDMQEVLYSNDTKYCNSEELAQQTVDAYKAGTHWDKPNAKIEAYYVNVGDAWVVKRKEDDKILKSLKYKPVKF